MKPLKHLIAFLFFFVLANSVYAQGGGLKYRKPTDFKVSPPSNPTKTQHTSSYDGVWQVLILVATAEKSIQKEAELYLEQAIKTTRTMADLMNLRYDLIVIKGDRLNPNDVRDKIQMLKNQARPYDAQGPNKKFMFSLLSFTHGVNYQNTNTPLPFIICHPTKRTVVQSETRMVISLAKLYYELQKNSAYDHIHIWSELCDHVPKNCLIAPKEDLLGLATKGGEGNHLKQLLYSVRAEIMVSSSYGQQSCSAGGGYFSQTLFETLGKVMKANIKASFKGNGGVFENVKVHTRLKSKTLKKGRNACEDQTPQCYEDADVPLH